MEQGAGPANHLSPVQSGPPAPLPPGSGGGVLHLPLVSPAQVSAGLDWSQDPGERGQCRREPGGRAGHTVHTPGGQDT